MVSVCMVWKEKLKTGLNVLVKPNSRDESIEWNGEVLKVSITAPAEDNKANIAVIKLVSREAGCQVRILRGLTSKKKVLKAV